jgi:hypothetical protein
MPKKLDDCVKALIEDGFDEENAWAICTAQMNEDFEDAEYQGEDVTLNKPFRTPDESKKFAVYVKNKRGNVIKVRFGDPDMEIKRDDAERKKSFRARFKCDERTDKTTPAYWSCKLWGDTPVSEITDSKLKTAFNDKACFDAEKKYCASVRDGVQEYHASELGLEGDRMVKVYRSPETVAEIADALNGLKVTNDHVPLTDIDEDLILGEIFDSELVEHFDEELNTTMLVRNGIRLSDKMVKLLADGKKELSLGYRADMIDSELYDFEVINIEPHHLALVDRARCGKACTFEDRGVKPMDFKKLFADAGIIAKDEEGAVNMAKVMELVKELPELVKTASLDELKALVPVLEEIMAKAKQGDEAEDTTEQPLEDEDIEDESTDEEMQDEEGEDDKKKMSDAKFAALVAKKAQELADKKLSVIAKAKDFLGEDYDYSVSTQKIMADAVKTQHGDSFSDSELQTAFKMLKKVTNYDGFGASKTLDPYMSIGEKEI